MPIASKVIQLAPAGEAPLYIPLTNATFGDNLAVNATFSGTPEGIHDGTDTALWTASAISGPWVFNSLTNPDTGTRCVAAIGTANGDAALFEDGTSTNMSTHSALTGRVRLEAWGAGVKDIQFRFRLNGVDVGNPVNLSGYINVGILNAYQSFAIGKADFGITTETIDEFVVTTLHTTGVGQDYRLDNLFIQEIGDPLLYEASAPPNSNLYVSRFVFSFADNIGATLASNSMPALAYDQILGNPRLSNGIVITVTNAGNTNPVANFRDLKDLAQFGCDPILQISDGTKTLITFRCELTTPVILEGFYGDKITAIVTDNLSGLSSVNIHIQTRFRPFPA